MAVAMGSFIIYENASLILGNVQSIWDYLLKIGHTGYKLRTCTYGDDIQLCNVYAQSSSTAQWVCKRLFSKIGT